MELWFEIDDKNLTEEEFAGKIWDSAMIFKNNMEGFYSSSLSYFEDIEYKNYGKSVTEKGDKITEDMLLQNPHLTFNVTASCVETASNKIAKAKPKVTFLTNDGNRENKELALKLDSWILKIFKRGKIWNWASQAFKSACITGIGIIKIVIKDKKIKFYKIPVFDFFCENFIKGPSMPTVAGEIKAMSIYDLIKMYPDRKNDIKEVYNEQKTVNVLEIYKKSVKQIICTKKLMLTNEKWDKPLPYLFLKWEKSDQGVLSVGICKKLNAIQSSITYILGKTFQSVRNFAVPRVFLGKSAGEPTVKDISNIVGEIIEINDMEGKAVQFSTPPAMNNQVLEILLMLWQKAFEIIGISELSAGGKIPRGLEKASGAALRSYQQVESERFQLIRADYEQFFIDVTKLIFKLIPDSMLPEGVTRSDIESAKDYCTIWTSSLLPETPAGKLATVTDLFNTGLLSGDQALDLLQSPDVKAYIKSETVRMRAIDLLIDSSLKNNIAPPYYSPLGLDLYLEVSRKKFAQLILDNIDNKGVNNSISILGDFVNELEEKFAEKNKLNDTLNMVATVGEGAGAGANQPLSPPITE